eukprot:CAMPEP_0180681508 /NCGR_PEP_ID=MMETSP1037_2-20121125/70034_1 /TAXON_ID=632150 /ORGANISM="Azadinium spinosum, Strain 3D9" /LENGTH=30 /DNA_ID= /DNA_START= /DNA_END= /DNA_ORIENTATION=
MPFGKAQHMAFGKTEPCMEKENMTPHPPDL